MDKKALIGFAAGGVLVGGLVWMTRPTPAPAPAPSEVVAEVREVPSVTPDAPAEAPAPEPVKAPVAAKPKPKPAAKPSPVASKPAPTKPAPVVNAPAPAPAPSSSTNSSASSNSSSSGPVFEPGPGQRDDAASRPYRQDPPPPPVKKREPNQVTIAAGTPLKVRLGDTLSTEKNKVGDTFAATLDAPLVVNGLVLAEKGSAVKGKIASIYEGGRVKGVAEMHVELTSVKTSDGQNLAITTDSFIKQADTSKKSDAAKVGIGAGIGAAIGAIAGGGRGAAIGAGAGGAAGAGTVLATRGKAAELPVETLMTFHLGSAVTVTEKLDN